MSATVPDQNTYFFEEVELDEDDNLEYKEVSDLDTDQSESEDDFQAVVKSLNVPTGKDGVSALHASASVAEGQELASGLQDVESEEPSELVYIAEQSEEATLINKPVVVDDFIRNFFIKIGMKKSLSAFQAEWYEMKQQGRLFEEDASTVPNLYVRNKNLDDQVKRLRDEVGRSRAVAERARSTWERFKKERDFHRMHHRRVQQEKDTLIKDMKRLQKHYDAYAPAVEEYKVKFEAANKEKMLMKLERDKALAKAQALETQFKASMDGLEGAEPMAETKARRSTQRMDSTMKGSTQTLRNNKSTLNFSKREPSTAIPREFPSNPYAEADLPTTPAAQFALRKTFKGHQAAVSGCKVFLKNKKAIAATVSDDATWKLWSLPKGDLIMSGDGHTDWISGLAFHPHGTHLATGAGDATVKIWDFSKASCVATFKDHAQAVWSVDYHHSGQFLASGSMDQTARLWDIAYGRCKQTFRGHVDAINTVAFLPYSNTLGTASGDKTCSLWDIRTGMCVATLSGHENAVMHMSFSMQGDAIASSDADGVVKLWDVRTMSERVNIPTCREYQRHAVNETQFDPSGGVIACGTNNGFIHIFDTSDGSNVGSLEGHEDSVQSLAFHPEGAFLVSASSDKSFRIWS